MLCRSADGSQSAGDTSLHAWAITATGKVSAALITMLFNLGHSFVVREQSQLQQLPAEVTNGQHMSSGTLYCHCALNDTVLYSFVVYRFVWPD